MGFHPQLFGIFLHLTPRTDEGVVDGDVCIFVVRLEVASLRRGFTVRPGGDTVGSRFAAHHQFRPGHTQFNPDMKMVAPFMVPMRSFNRHPATGDAVKEGFEFCRLGFDPGRQRSRGLHVAEGDMYWYFHGATMVPDAAAIFADLGKERTKNDQYCEGSIAAISTPRYARFPDPR